ncbi:MAG: M20/M25/M40 family metallo-hydrolase [Filifactoraceae bacterium]
MNKNIAKRIEEIAIELTEVLSVVDTKGEIDSVKKVHEIFSKMDYYKENPQDLRILKLNDSLDRIAIIAILRGKKASSKKTVVCIGHTDTVGIGDYGSLKEFANKPYELTKRIEALTLPDEVRRDLESGNYLFGRGIFDMKGGDAILMALMEDISKNIDEFEGNIIFAGVCDEEGNSGGMLRVVPELVKMKKEEGFDYLALLDTDYMTSEFEGDENKYVYIGTVGKLMPSFFVVGKETHVGESFKGIDPNQIASSIVERINLNTDFCDVAEGEVSLPPITLFQRDLKPEYSCQIATTTNLYFNYATHCSTPDEVLIKMTNAAQEAFEKTIVNLDEQYRRFCELSEREYKKLPWKARTISYEKLIHMVKDEIGEDAYNKEMSVYSELLLADKSLDTRAFALKMVEKVHSLWSDRNPIVVVYFSPPYYPHIYVEGKEDRERKLLEAVADAVNTTKTEYKLVYKKFFPYISDLSYGAAPKDPRIIAALKDNMPGFGSKYTLPIEDMQELDLPVLDIGCFGKDAHKFTERIEKNYSFNVAPELVYKTIINLLSK